MPRGIASYLKRLALSCTRNPFVQVSATWDPSGPRIPMAVYSSGVNMPVVENVQLKFQKLDNMNYYIWWPCPDGAFAMAMRVTLTRHRLASAPSPLAVSS